MACGDGLVELDSTEVGHRQITEHYVEVLTLSNPP